MAGFVSTHSLARPVTSPATRAGIPTAIMPSGTTIPGGTVAPAAIRARRPTTPPSRTAAPWPTSASAPMTAPCTTHRWPTVAPADLGHRVVAAVQHRTVLDVRTAPDDDRAEVGAQHGAVPDGGLGLDP